MGGNSWAHGAVLGFAALELARKGGVPVWIAVNLWAIAVGGALVSSQFLGPLGDRLGRRGLMVVGQSAAALVLLALPLTTSNAGMLVSLAVALGATGVTRPFATSYAQSIVATAALVERWGAVGQLLSPLFALIIIDALGITRGLGVVALASVALVAALALAPRDVRRDQAREPWWRSVRSMAAQWFDPRRRRVYLRSLCAGAFGSSTAMNMPVALQAWGFPLASLGMLRLTMLPQIAATRAYVERVGGRPGLVPWLIGGAGAALVWGGDALLAAAGARPPLGILALVAAILLAASSQLGAALWQSALKDAAYGSAPSDERTRSVASAGQAAELGNIFGGTLAAQAYLAAGPLGLLLAASLPWFAGTALYLVARERD